jgi:hypothetical protein
MASLRAKLAEMERRLIALEARQIAWAHDSAIRGGSPASHPPSLPDDLVDVLPSSDMMAALAELRASCTERGERPEQVDVFTENGETCARAWFVDGSDAFVTFKTPPAFRARDAKRLFEEALLDVQ